MALLALKLTVTPVVIAAATLVARRFGPAVAGWLIGLPVTGGPVVLLLALAHGPRFAAGVAGGFVVGVAAEVAFALGYVAVARRGWRVSLAVGSAAFAAAGLALVAAHVGFAVLVAVALGALAVGLLLLPAGEPPPAVPPGRYDLPLRIALATGLVVAVTGLAATLGAALSGLVTTYPLLSTLLACFAHRRDGPGAAVAVYRGLLVGLFALTGFACTLAVVLTRLPLAAAFALALATTLAIQTGSLRAVRA